MQTFLPSGSFHESAKMLDNKRLGKQRVECWQILNALQGKTRGWVNHPAVKMWRGHEYWLIIYAIVICDEWIRRGYRDTMRERFMEEFVKRMGGEDKKYPEWLSDEDFHNSHKAMLYHKDPTHYAQFAGYAHITEYVWPTP